MTTYFVYKSITIKVPADPWEWPIHLIPERLHTIMKFSPSSFFCTRRVYSVRRKSDCLPVPGYDAVLFLHSFSRLSKQLLNRQHLEMYTISAL